MPADSTTWYNYNFDVYLGRNQVVVRYPKAGLATRVVLELSEPISNHGYQLYMDRFYTSFALLYHLQRRQIYACGTAMTNRCNFPRALVRRERDTVRGDYDWLMCHTTGILATVWRDTKLVYYLSTIHVPELEDCHVVRHDRQGNEIGVNATPCVVEYNMFMGGVDLNDKMCTLDKSRKTYHWYNRVARKCLMWAAFNGYVIEGHFVPHVVGGQRKRDFDSFILDLCHGLMGNFSARKQRQRQHGHRPDRIVDVNVQHNPVMPDDGGKDHLCTVCYEKYKRFAAAHPDVAYKDMPCKKVKTSVQCSKCLSWLCVKRGSTYWQDYHTRLEYWH